MLNIRGVRYEWKDTERFGSQTEIGFVAQELEPVLPEVVRSNNEYFTVKIQNVVAVVVEAIKELNVKVENYFSRTETLEREVADLRADIELLKRSQENGAEESTNVENSEDESEHIDTEIPTEDSVVEEIPVEVPEVEEEVIEDSEPPPVEAESTVEETVQP